MTRTIVHAVFALFTSMTVAQLAASVPSPEAPVVQSIA